MRALTTTYADVTAAAASAAEAQVQAEEAAAAAAAEAAERAAENDGKTAFSIPSETGSPMRRRTSAMPSAERSIYSTTSRTTPSVR